MLFDEPRTNAFRRAFELEANRELMRGKVVLDVGCGSGVLSLFAARAGASRVYCVEYTQIAQTTRQIVAANGFAGVIEVIQGKVEEVTLPGAVDVIVSEWLGYFALFEGMFRSVLWARDRWLAPGGRMLPERIEMFVAGARSPAFDNSKELKKWRQPIYDLDFSPMAPVLEAYAKFQHEAQLDNWRSGSYPEIRAVSSKQLLTAPAKVADFAMSTVTAAELDVLTHKFKTPVTADGELSSLVGWFTATFEGPEKVLLETGPANRQTHWHQMVFHFAPVPVQRGEVLTSLVSIDTSGAHHREMTVQLGWRVGRKGDADRAKGAKGYTVVIIPDATNWGGV